MTAQHRHQAREVYQLRLAREEKASDIFVRQQVNLRVIVVANDKRMHTPGGRERTRREISLPVGVECRCH